MSNERISRGGPTRVEEKVKIELEPFSSDGKTMVLASASLFGHKIFWKEFEARDNTTITIEDEFRQDLMERVKNVLSSQDDPQCL